MSGNQLINLEEIPVDKLMEYRCVKTVRALKIIGLSAQELSTANSFSPPLNFPFHQHDPHTLVVRCERGICYDVKVSLEFIEKRNVTLDGYLVLYNDGYVSFSPTKAFEEGYRLICNDPHQLDTSVFRQSQNIDLS